MDINKVRKATKKSKIIIIVQKGHGPWYKPCLTTYKQTKMENPNKYTGASDVPRGRYNRRRLVVLMVVIFVVVLSFFAGRLSGGNGHKTYIQTGARGTTQHPGSDRVGIPPGPPDSLSP